MTTPSTSPHAGTALAPGGAAAPSAALPLRQPRFDIPVELSNIATSICQLSHHQNQAKPNKLIGNGIDLLEQSKQIYRDAIRSVQEQIRLVHLSSRQALAAQNQAQAQLVLNSTDDDTRSSAPQNNNSKHVVVIDSSSPHSLYTTSRHNPKRKGILVNPQDDVWSSVPELSRARQVLVDARRGMIKLQLQEKDPQSLHHLDAPTATTGSSGHVKTKDGVSPVQQETNNDQINSAATIGMYDRPITIPSIASHVVPRPTSCSANSPPSSTVHSHLARNNKASEYISAIVLYNFALMHHLDALRTNNIPMLAQSADLYDMTIQVMHAELEDVLKEYATHHHVDPEGGDVDASNTATNDNGGNVQVQFQTCMSAHQDPTLYQLQQVARTAMGAALTNAGLIYHAFSQHVDATAVFNVLLQLCDVQSRHFLRRRRYMHQNRRRDANTFTRSTHDEDHGDSQEEQVGPTANTSPSLPTRTSQTIGTSHASFEHERVWDHFFCAAYALRAGTIAPCA